MEPAAVEPLHIDPKADQRLVLDALMMGLDLCSPTKPLSAPVRRFLTGETSVAALVATILQHGQEACRLPAQMALGKVPQDDAVAQAFAHGAYQLTAGAAMLLGDPKFSEVARAAGLQMLAVVAQLGGPVERLRQELAAAARQRRLVLTLTGRNQPCGCGSGKKSKLCCAS